MIAHLFRQNFDFSTCKKKPFPDFSFAFHVVATPRCTSPGHGARRYPPRRPRCGRGGRHRGGCVSWRAHWCDWVQGHGKRERFVQIRRGARRALASGQRVREWGDASRCHVGIRRGTRTVGTPVSISVQHNQRTGKGTCHDTRRRGGARAESSIIFSPTMDQSRHFRP